MCSNISTHDPGPRRANVASNAKTVLVNRIHRSARVGKPLRLAHATLATLRPL